MTRELFFDSLVRFKLPRSSCWRQNLQAKYPDPRNAQAARMLAALAEADLNEVRADTWALLDPHIGSSELEAAVSAASRDVGFRTAPENIDQFLGLVTERLELVSGVAR